MFAFTLASLLNKYVLGGMAIVIAVMGIGGYFYYKSSQNRITNLELELQLKNIQIEQQAKAIETMKIQTEKVKKSLAELYKSQGEKSAKVEELRKKFDKNNRDIGNLALHKPNLIEKAINKGTKNALRCMEIASGSPLTESEQNELNENGSVAACRP